jgi:hypothetical protein
LAPVEHPFLAVVYVVMLDKTVLLQTLSPKAAGAAVAL